MLSTIFPPNIIKKKAPPLCCIIFSGNSVVNKTGFF